MTGVTEKRTIVEEHSNNTVDENSNAKRRYIEDSNVRRTESEEQESNEHEEEANEEVEARSNNDDDDGEEDNEEEEEEDGEEEDEDDEEDDEDEDEEEDEDDGETDDFINRKKELNENEEFKLSHQYRELNKNLEEQRTKLTTDSGVSIVKKTLEEAEELFEGAKTSSNTVIIATDSATLKEIGEQAKIATQNVKFGRSEKVIKFDQFASSWIRCFGSITHQQHRFSERDDVPEYNWTNAGLLYNSISKSITGCDFLLGPLDIEKKKRTSRARLVDDSKRTATKTANLKMANEVVNKDTENDTSKAAEKFFKTLQNHGKRISIFEAVLHPTSFGKTIEALFVCSFLINNGLLLMNNFENNIPYLEVVNQENVRSQPRYKTNDDGKSHIVFNLDEDTWKKLVEVYQITVPFFSNSGL